MDTRKVRTGELRPGELRPGDLIHCGLGLAVVRRIRLVRYVEYTHTGDDGQTTEYRDVHDQVEGEYDLVLRRDAETVKE